VCEVNVCDGGAEGKLRLVDGTSVDNHEYVPFAMLLPRAYDTRHRE
jgi:hypothetical protein